MLLDRSDTSTHVMCASCQQYHRCTPQQAYNFFSDAKICPPELLWDMHTAGIDIVFEDGCPECHPGVSYRITTTTPRHCMH
jgi:hypothetical protein